ncbi:MAG TPA: PAS domain S-box protein, partial [Chthoniobacteraceae bacterium]
RLAVDMQRAMRGFELTGSPEILQPWKAARKRIGPNLGALKALVIGNADHAAQVAEMQARLAQWQAHADESLARFRAVGAAPDSVRDAREKTLFDAFRQSIASFIAAEEREQIHQARRLSTLRTTLLATTLLAALAGIPALVVAFRRLVRQVSHAYSGSLSRAEAQRDELRVTLSSIGDAVLATDAAGAVTFLNPVAERLTGWSDAEAQGRSMAEVFPIFKEGTEEPAADPVDLVLREGVARELANHTVLRPRGGGEIPIEDSAAPIFGAEGKLRGVILVFHDASEKYARDRELRKAEWLTRTALEVGGGGAWVLELKKNVVFCDAVMAHLCGIPLERCRAGEPVETFFAAVHQDDRARVQAGISDALVTGNFHETEYRVIGNGGVERWVNGMGRVELDATGKASQIAGVVFDITTRKQTEHALRESEARARAVFDTAIDGVLLMGADGKITGWNPAAERIFGWSREEVLGSDLASRIIPERMREAHHRGLAHYLATGEGPVLGRRLELPAIRRDGSEFPVELSINPLRGVARPTFVGFIRDISQRRAAEAELSERATLSHLRAEIAAKLASPGDLGSTLHGCCELLVSHLDAAFARVWVLDEEERVLLLRASAGLYTHLDGPHARVPVGEFKIGRIAQFRRAHLTNDVAHDPNISNPEWAKREGMSAFAGYPLISEGRVMGVLALFSKQALSEAVLGDLAPIADAVAMNIERRAAEAALIAQKERAEIASRAKDDFLAALSHELRTPLTPVLMTATSLREDERIPADAREELAMIERNIALEARLIDDLLDLTSITKGKFQLREEACDVHSLIGLAVEIVRDDAQSKPVVLDVDLTARRTALRGDPARLQQVFWNLLRNAIKFTPVGGRITIHTRDETDERLRIEVTDTGIGLAPDALTSIFQPFEQAGREGDHRFGGLGLGLAIARAIVDLHGGTIRAESAGPGTGATFVVELPGVREQLNGMAPASSAEENHAPASIGTSPSLRLLLVEDHEPTITVLRRLLIRAGHTVVTASSVAAAVAAAEAGQFDVVISDWGLPDGTGLEVIAKLHALQPQLRGIALSGYGMEDDLRRSLAAGFTTHLVKPVDFDQLRRALREISTA